MAIHVALALALAGSLSLAGLLWAWADRGVAGARLLVVFLLGVAVWIAGNELPTWFGPGTDRLALSLLATAPLTSAAFFHFAVAFAGARPPRWAVPSSYALGAAATLLALVFRPGGFEPFAGVGLVAMPNAVGWAASLAWGLLAAAGHLVLLRAALRSSGPVRRQVTAVMASSAWGLLCMSGYGIAALRLDLYPWPLLGLPLYPLVLVYGILRYRVLVVNAWARRALVWTVLVAGAALCVALAPLLLPSGDPGALPWLSGAAAGAAFLALGGPARRLAERLVYPGGAVSADDLAAWRAGLSRADSPAALAEAAGGLLSARLRTPIAAEVEGAPPPATGQRPRLSCAAGPDGAWRTGLSGWDAAPPGPRRVAELFGAVLAEEAARLSRAAVMARRERAEAERARLAELGELAATVAHDIRNPLNVISMAAVEAPPGARAEIREQVGRVSRLAQDLLDYAKPWRVEPVEVDLAAEARAAAARRPGLELGPGLRAPLPARADPRRLQQALANLLDNAGAAPGATRVALDAEAAADGGARLHVCDDGAGVPEDLRGTLFRPFASRAPGDTGLGLAIVAKIMAAHGGSVALTERPGWHTCFTLSFPPPLGAGGTA